MKILSRFTLGSILLLCAAQAVWAFGIEPVVNGVGAEHQRITRAAIDGVDAQTLAWLAGTDEEPGAVGLPDVEGAQDLAALHCDNGDYLAPASDEPPYAQTEAEAEAALTACRALSFAELDRAVAAAKPLAAPTSQNTALDCRFDGAPTSAKCEVILHLGLALHIAQDFYAHTNWADQAAQGAHSPTNPPGLAKSGRAAWLDPRAKDIAFPKGLISGCIVNAIALRQCAYGDWALVPFLGAKRVTREDLAKDRGPIGRGQGGLGQTLRGAIGSNFNRAVVAAIDDTKDKWAYFKERVRAAYPGTAGETILCAFGKDQFDAGCVEKVAHSGACAARRAHFVDGQETTDPLAEPTEDERAEAGRLWEGLRDYCRLEEASLTRDAVVTGGKSQQGLERAKAGAVEALARWNACPAEARAYLGIEQPTHQASFHQIGAASKGKEVTALLTAIYADCMVAARVRQLGK